MPPHPTVPLQRLYANFLFITDDFFSILEQMLCNLTEKMRPLASRCVCFHTCSVFCYAAAYENICVCDIVSAHLFIQYGKKGPGGMQLKNKDVFYSMSLKFHYLGVKILAAPVCMPVGNRSVLWAFQKP